MEAFCYRRIGQAFIAELYGKVSSGESVVLLGPRYCGKRFLMANLRRTLGDTPYGPTVQVQFLREGPVTQECEAFRLVSQAVADTGENLQVSQEPTDNLLGPIDLLSSLIQKPIVLLAANVDGMAYHLARRFLEEVQTRIKSETLIAVLSGEGDFKELVHGPKSEFNCANQYVLQGFDKDEFTRYVERHAAALNLSFSSPEEAHRHLWSLTGGNVYMLRPLLWELAEARVLYDRPLPTTLAVADIFRFLGEIDILRVDSVPALRRAEQVIAREPSCWTAICDLIDGASVKVQSADGAPTPLELAGVGVRTLERQGRLEFASELMKQFVCRHYTHSRLGDLYARNAEWEKAFEHYAQLAPEERLRPSSIDDRADVEFTVRALCAALHSAATGSGQNIKHLFDRGCRYLLGFPQTTFWGYDKRWRLAKGDQTALSKHLVDEITAILPSGKSVSPGLLPVPVPWQKYTVAAIVPAFRSDQQKAVVFGDFDKKTIMSAERERLARELTRHFVEAYTHAISVKKDHVRLSVRNRHAEIVNSIFDALGSRVLDVGHVIAYAAKGLRELGYRRVLFCLVDPERKRIQGVLDNSDDPSVDVAKMTDWPLDKPKADLQPYVIHTRQPKVVDDASREPLANKRVARGATIVAAAIIPVLNRADEAIGTIHVERSDGTVPSQEEVEDLMAFGRQLAIAIEQSERVNLLQCALDKMPEPVVIADLSERPRYANASAAQLLGIKQGWRDQSETEPLSWKDMRGFRECLRESLASRRRTVRHIEELRGNSKYSAAVLCDEIRDWRERSVGALLHVQNLDCLRFVIAATRAVAEKADASSALRAMLALARSQGHKWGRLWLIDEKHPERLVSAASFGFADRELQAAFEERQLALPLTDDASDKSWFCIKRKVPFVFCWKADLPDGERFVTAHGLVAINFPNPRCQSQLSKKPGDFWIDFPLLTHSKPLGKLTFQCDENLLPEQFEMIRVLSEVAAGLLDAFLRRERWIQQAVQETAGITAHHIASPLSALQPLLERYRLREEQVPELHNLNDEFSCLLGEILDIALRANQRLSGIYPRVEKFDLVGHVKRCLQAQLKNIDYEVKCKAPRLETEADPNLFEAALLELTHNSRKASIRRGNLRIIIAIDSVRRESHKWVRIVYKDNGPGIPSGFKKRVFENFFSRWPGQGPGTGLGLGFVRRMVEAHGGTVYERGKPGHGAEFVIEVPRYAMAHEKKEEVNVSDSHC